jgi:4-hydroxybenzoyl-CoA reductase subunit alpha
MAQELRLDAFALRRANLIAPPYRAMNDLQVNSCGLGECLEKVEAASSWRERKGRMPSGRGLGMACSHYVSGAAKPVHWTGEPHATVNLRLDFDGSITLLTGAADSALTPKDNGSYSSRVSYMGGNAALAAAREMKKVLDVAGGSTFEERVRNALKDTGPITTRGTYTVPPELQGGKFRGAAVGPSPAFSYAAQVVEVAVDEDTGEVRVEKIWVAQDCGFAINPLAVEGQIQGAVWMGMGQALGEATRSELPHGLPSRANFLDYRFPTIADSPPIETFIVEARDPHGPFGAKEASEGALAGFLPAFTNAVADAVGIRAHELPLTADALFEALRKRRRAEKLKAA